VLTKKYIFIAVINRDQNHMWLNKYDATTGDFVKTLFEEIDKENYEDKLCYSLE
jgi:dipeptidyl-peptidase-4